MIARGSGGLAVYQWTLFALLFFFCLRVLGQILVMFFHVKFLPPAEEWFSGLMPYPRLLVSQILIICLYGKICFDLFRGDAYFAHPSRRLGAVLLIFGSLYLGAMIIRYITRMTLYPKERWVGGCIPIFFHWVLSTFLIVLGSYHWQNASRLESNAGRIGLPYVAFALIGTFFVLLWASYQMAPSLSAARMGFGGSMFAVRSQKQVSMVSSDGTSFVVDIYHPQRATKTSTLLVRVPDTSSRKDAVFAGLIAKMCAERGYRVIVEKYLDARGSGSPGNSAAQRDEAGGIREGLEKQTWFDGDILRWEASSASELLQQLQSRRLPVGLQL